MPSANRATTRGDKGFLFLNFATCGSCGYCITGERHVKKSGLRFHLLPLHAQEQEAALRRPQLHPRRKIRRGSEAERGTWLPFPTNGKRRFLATIETWEADEVARRSKRKLTVLKADLAALQGQDRPDQHTASPTAALELQEFKELKNPLDLQEEPNWNSKLPLLEKSKANRLEPLRNWILEANQAEKWVSEDNWLEMKSFLQKVGSNRLLRAQTLTVSFKKPFDLLAETNVAVAQRVRRYFIDIQDGGGGGNRTPTFSLRTRRSTN